MALLDVFQIVFETNSQEAKKGLAEVQGGANKAGDAAEDAAKKFESLKKQQLDAAKKVGAELGTMLAGYFAVGAAMDRIAEVNAIAQTAETIGDSVENVDAFGRALAEMGGDAQGARDTLTDLAESMGEAMKDKDSARFKQFNDLNVALKDAQGNARGVTDVMLDLASAVEGMSKQEAVFKIKELGITDNRSVEAILKGRKELERMLRVQKDQGVVSKETAEASMKFTDALNRLKGAAKNSGSGLLDAIIPALTTVLEWLNKASDWARENKDFVTGFFIAIGAVVARAYLPAMIQAAIATMAVYGPMILIGAAIAAVAALFALAYDDIMNFIAGNDSLIGQIFDKYPAIKEMIFAVIGAFQAFGGVVKEVMLGAWEVVKSVAGFMTDAIGSVIKAFSGLGAAINWAAEGLGFGANVDVSAANGALSSAGANPMNATTSNAISNTTNASTETNVNVGKVEVTTQATDAQGMAKGASNALGQQLKNLSAESSTGVAR